MILLVVLAAEDVHQLGPLPAHQAQPVLDKKSLLQDDFIVSIIFSPDLVPDAADVLVLVAEPGHSVGAGCPLVQAPRPHPLQVQQHHPRVEALVPPRPANVALRVLLLNNSDVLFLVKY